jgi:hypothetical protein
MTGASGRRVEKRICEELPGVAPDEKGSPGLLCPNERELIRAGLYQIACLFVKGFDNRTFYT